MESARVAAAVRQIMDETASRAPRAGRNVLMLAWFEDEMGALPRNPSDYDIISLTAPLGGLCGDASCPDADRKVFLSLYFMTECFMQSLMPIADEGSPLFRMLTTTAAKCHPVRRVNAPDPNKELMIDLFAAAAVAYVERHDGWEQAVEALGVAIVALVSPVIPEEAPKGADEVLAVILQDIAARPECARWRDRWATPERATSTRRSGRALGAVRPSTEQVPKFSGHWFPENGSQRSVFPVEQFLSGNQCPLFFGGTGEPHPFICISRPSRTS